MKEKVNKTILGEDDFASFPDMRKAQVERILSCYTEESIKKSTDTDRDEFTGPQKGQNKLRADGNGFDNKNITQESEPYLHHKLMAGYHRATADELNQESLKLNTGTDEETLSAAKTKKAEAKRHNELADQHRELAKAVHDEKKNGKWNDTIPTKKQAIAYGSKQSKAIDKKTAGGKESEKDYEDVKKSVLADIQKGDISYKMSSSYGGDQPILFTKKGSELKETSKIKKVQLDERLAATQTELTVLKTNLEEEGIKFIANGNSNNPNPCPVYQKDMDKDTESLFYKYQDLLYRYNDLRCDIKALEIIIENAEDNKNYTCSIGQLISLEKAQENDIEKGEKLKKSFEALGLSNLEDNDLFKAEGSKGGKVIGHTKSGKPIYSHKNAKHSDYENFTSAEHREASDIHYTKADEHAAKVGDDKDDMNPDFQAFMHQKNKAEGHEKEAKEKKGLKKSEAYNILMKQINII
jgi:hypothetical protein